MRAVRPSPFPADRPRYTAAGASEVSRFSCRKCLGVSGVYDYAGLPRDSRWRPCACCLPLVRRRRHPDCNFSKLHTQPTYCWDRTRARQLGATFPEAPPIIPDGRFSQVRFETLAFLPWAFPASRGVKRWYAGAPASVVCPQPRPIACVGSTPTLRPATALPMRPPSVQSPFARYR